MDDDNVIKPNQDFQIPPTTADDQAVNGTQSTQDSNITQNVNNNDTNSSQQDSTSTQTTIPSTDNEPIKINDPYDFVLGNKATTPPSDLGPAIPTDSTEPNSLGDVGGLPHEDNDINTQNESNSHNTSNINTSTNPLQEQETSGSDALGGLDYSQSTVPPSASIPKDNTLLGSDYVEKNKEEINNVLNSALSMDNFKNLNKPLDPQEVPDPYTNTTQNSNPEVNVPSTNSSPNVDVTQNLNAPTQTTTQSGNTYQNPDFVSSNTDSDLPPIPAQDSQQQGGFSQTSEGTFINPYATSNTNTTPSNQPQGQELKVQNQNTETPPDRSEDIFGVVSYVIGLNVLMLIYSYLKNDKFLKFHAVQSIGFNLVFIIIFLIFTSFSRGSFSLAFLVANVVLFIVWVLLSILLMYKAYQGEKYPFIFFGTLAGKLS